MWLCALKHKGQGRDLTALTHPVTARGARLQVTVGYDRAHCKIKAKAATSQRRGGIHNNIIRLGTFPQVSLILTFADVPSAVETFVRTCAGFPVIARSFWVALQNSIKENVGVGDEVSACPVQVGFAVANS